MGLFADLNVGDKVTLKRTRQAEDGSRSIKEGSEVTLTFVDAEGDSFTVVDDQGVTAQARAADLETGETHPDRGI